MPSLRLTAAFELLRGTSTLPEHGTPRPHRHRRRSPRHSMIATSRSKYAQPRLASHERARWIDHLDHMVGEMNPPR